MTKKYMLASAFLVIALAAVIGSLLLPPGFQKRTDVCLQDFSVSEDGSAITIQTALAGSMGYIRDIETETAQQALYCSFYRAFGGLNFGIGAKNRFTIQLDDSTEKIYFDRGEEPSFLVLERDVTTGVWRQP